MIKAVVHKGLGAGQVIEGVTRLVVYDKFDNPISLVLVMPDGSIVTSDWEDPNWNTVLANLGIRKTVIVQDLAQVPLDQVRFDR